MSRAYFEDLLSDPRWTSEERAFIEFVCGPTPFIVEFLDSELKKERITEIKDWCTEKYGDPSDPFRGKTGDWRICSISDQKSICFRLEEQLSDFLTYRKKLKQYS